MSATAAFVLGLLIGWVIEWIIDWWYWRRRLSALQTELNQTKTRLGLAESAANSQAAVQDELRALQQKTAALKADNTALSQQISALSNEKAALADQLTACQANLRDCEAARTAVPVIAAVETQTIPVRAVPMVAVKPDDLEIIKGIGPVINRKLNQAGICTFEQLAALTPARLVEIVGEVIQRLADEEDIIQQAKEFAAQKASRG
jgi:predicted flap endonuclease-1-like 5' DNA nuclease